MSAATRANAVLRTGILRAADDRHVRRFMDRYGMRLGAGRFVAGETIEYEYPDMYGRPWDKIWREYFEQGMSGKPEDNVEELFDFSGN